MKEKGILPFLNLGGAEANQTIYKNWREGLIRPMMISGLVFGLISVIAAVLTAQNIIQSAIYIGAYLIFFALVVLLPTPYWFRAGISLLIVYGLGLGDLITFGILGDSVFFFLAFIIFATIFYSPRGGIIASAITTVTFGIVAWLSLSGKIIFLSSAAIPAKLPDWASNTANTLLFSALIIIGLYQLEVYFFEAQNKAETVTHELEDEKARLEDRVTERTLQLKAVNEVGQAASAILEPDELATRAVNLITDRFGFYYAAIFLLDEKGEWAELRSATGEAGRVLKENKHRLRVGGQSMVGTAISTGNARIALDVGAEPIRFENPLLPYTRSEVALPLISSDRVLGALDVQSTQESAFGTQEVDTLQSMAQQVAIALENARLFQDARKAIEEMQAIQQQYVLKSWGPLTEREGLEYKVGDEELSSEAPKLEVPLTLREEIIGHINLAADGEWTPEQRNLIEAVATQAALALENARLMEESQSSAARDRLIADITGKIWSSPTIDGILQSAVRELGLALDATEATIELKVEDNG